MPATRAVRPRHDCVFIPPASEYLLPILEVVPLQLFAYFMAVEHGVTLTGRGTCRRRWWRNRSAAAVKLQGTNQLPGLADNPPESPRNDFQPGC